MLTEKSYTLAAASTVDERKAQYKAFFEDILSAEFPLVHDADSDYYWLDENKNCGFYLYASGTTNTSYQCIQAAYSYGEPQTVNTYNGNNILPKNQTFLFYHVSKDKNVIYLREKGWDISSGTTSENNAKKNCYVAAKDETGAWHMFSGNYLFNSEGQFNSQNSALVDTKSPFIATKMVTPGGAKFLELNKLFFATSFEISSTLVAFDGVPHRVVSVDGINPCFTFPVSEN